MPKPSEPLVAISTRSLTWLGGVSFLFSLSVLAILVVDVPPVSATIVLLFIFVFLTVTALVVTLFSWILNRRGHLSPRPALFHGTVAGVFATLLLVLQYFALLDWVTALVSLLFVLVSEVVHVQLRARDKPPKAVATKKKRGVKGATSPEGTTKSKKNTLAAGTKRVSSKRKKGTTRSHP